MLDVASLHPELRSAAGDLYYKECAKLRAALRAALSDILALDSHRLFVVPSVTAALMSFLLDSKATKLNREGFRRA